MIELFKDIKVDWLGKRKMFLAISGAFMLLGLISLVAKGGFNYGVDFKGGTIVQVRFQTEARYRKDPAAASRERRRRQSAPGSLRGATMS